MIVYNERGHRIEDDDIDVYPEDDVSSHNNNSRNNTNGRSSRSHTPVDSYYPPSSSHSRSASTAVIPDVSRVDPHVSKAYTPSITPSTRNATYRGSDGEKTGSDSERKKGKQKHIDDEKDRDRGMPGGPSPIERTTSNGPGSPIAKVGSTHSAIGGGRMSPSSWVPPVSASRSPSIKQPAYISDGDHNSVHDRPKSIIDEHRQSRLWDNSPPISPRSPALDAILDRPKSAYGQVGDQSRSHTPFGGSRPRTPLEPSAPGHTPGITRSNTPFIDRPKSGIEGSFDRPKSAFGGGSIYGDSGPAMFGDSGPAADIGTAAGTPLFGDPPASVFGDALANESGGDNVVWGATGGEVANDNWGITGVGANDNNWDGERPANGDFYPLAAEGAEDNWSMPVATTPTAEVHDVITTPSTTKKEKSKRKNSTAISAPASGLPSKTSPALSTKKSPFQSTADGGFYDDPVTTSLSPAIEGGGLWGSKHPSPKPLSPLNPASRMDNEPSATVQDDFKWSFESGAVVGTGGSNEPSWNDVDLGDNPTKTPSRAPSPIPPPPEEPAAVEKEPVTNVKGKKKKKGSTATTPAKSPHALTLEAAEKEEQERVRIETERLATEAAEADRLAAETAEANRLAAEAAEADRLATEAAEASRLAAEAEKLAAEAAAEATRLKEQQEKEQAEKEQAEKERAEKERAEKEQAEKEQAEKEQAEKEQAEKQRAEKERAEKERLEQERMELEKAEREKEQAEHDRLEQERMEQERLEQERLAQEEKDKDKTPVSAFESDPPTLFSGGLFSSSSLNSPDKPWMATDTGGGDDSWGSVGGWGGNTKKKKSKLGATPKPSAFGSTWGFGAGSVFGDTTTADAPLAEGLSSSQDAGGLISFSTTPNLSFGFADSTQPKSRANSPAPTPVAEEAAPAPVETETNPIEIVSPTAEGGDNDAPAEEEAFEVTVTSKSKKKKKKGDKGGTNAIDTGPGTEPKEDTPVEPRVEEELPPETPVETPAAEAFTQTSGKKKKKGGKK